MATKKSPIGKITIDCDCGAKLECPATMKGEITCSCGKTYGVNQERIITAPQPITIKPYPQEPYRRPNVPHWRWDPTTAPIYTTTCLAPSEPKTLTTL